MWLLFFERYQSLKIKKLGENETHTHTRVHIFLYEYKNYLSSIPVFNSDQFQSHVEAVASQLLTFYMENE